MQRKIEIILNTSELTAGTRGASLGPAAIMTAARKKESTFFGKIPLHPLPDFNFFLDQPTDTTFAKRVDGYSKVFYSVADKTREVLHSGAFPLVIAADHGSAAGTIAGIKAAYPSKRLGVVWIDAHGDLHSPYTTPSGNMHGMPLALTLGDDNTQCQRNTPSEKSVQKWNELKEAYTGSPKLSPSDLCFIAVRDTEVEENAIIERLNIKNHTVAEVRNQGAAQIVRAIEEQFKDCDLIYVSFDVDSMDPEITSFGTGTPVGNGLFPEEAQEILTLLAQNEKTCCIEIVEVNPCLDNKINTMAEVTFSIIESVFN